jgi:hypothetical protein
VLDTGVIVIGIVIAGVGGIYVEVLPTVVRVAEVEIPTLGATSVTVVASVDNVGIIASDFETVAAISAAVVAKVFNDAEAPTVNEGVTSAAVLPRVATVTGTVIAVAGAI